MLILYNIFVKLEGFILFNKFDKYHNFIYNRINMKLMVHVIGSLCQDVVVLQVLHIIFKGEASPSIYADWVNGGWF